MSYEAMHKVRASGLSDRTQVDVLEALAFFLNKETGACFPSTEAISRISRVNDRTVRLTLKVLHDLGFISSVQMPGQKRYFTLHLDRLPTSEAQQEPAPLQEITGEGCKKLQGTPAKTYRGPLQKLTPEQGINKESNKEGNKEDSAPAEWTFPEYQGTSPEKQGTSPENRGTVPQKRGRGSPENQDVTGNRNREIEQGSRTRNSLPAQAPWETDHFDNTVKKVEKPKATRAKPKTSCPFSPDDPIPPEYLEYAQAKHPSINAQTEFTKFVNFHISKDNKYSNWLAAWRTWATKAEEFASNRPKNQNQTFPFGKPTDPQYGIGVCQPPTEPPAPFDREAFEAEKQQMIAEGLIF